MPRRPTREWLRAEDLRRLKRHRDLRVAADAMTLALAGFPEVRAVAVIGSAARPLAWETPPGRPHGIRQLHDCGDLDMAVWTDDVTRLREIGRARGVMVRDLFQQRGIGLAHFEVELFLFEPGTDAYLGRVCAFAACPKGKRECLTPGCGRAPFLRQHLDFRLFPETLAEDRILRLYARGQGVLRKAAEVEDQPSLEDEEAVASAEWSQTPPPD